MTRIEHEAETDRFVAMLRALGNPARYYIFSEIVKQGEAAGNRLLVDLPLAQSTVSEHLRRLREVNLIVGETRGSVVWYTPNSEALTWFQEQVGRIEA